MTVVPFSAKAPTPGNSLGSAKDSCFTCSELKLECDRQRPRCFVCMQNQVKCRGYKLDLSWQSGVAAKGNLKGWQYPASESPIDCGESPSSRPSETSQGREKKRQNGNSFKFVTGRPVKRRKVREQVGQGRFDRHGPDRPRDVSPGSIASPMTRVIIASPEVSICQGKKLHYFILRL